jgi:6-hydroxytryprostatin B O-methyltransferase
LAFVVQDLPEVVAVGEQDLPPDLKSRFEFLPLDFWASSPVKGADVYLLRAILHDYPDELAIKLLENIVPSLKHGAKVILSEGVMPEPGTIPANEERVMR